MSNPDAPDVAALAAELADAQEAAAHWSRMFAAVVRSFGPVLVHPGDYHHVDPAGLGNVGVTVPGYPDQARMFFLPEHANAMADGMMDALGASLPVTDDGDLPHPDAFPGQPGADPTTT